MTGLSRSLEANCNHVAVGNQLGTVAYTAPEIFRDSFVTKPSDVYAFGILSECLAANSAQLPNRSRAVAVHLQLLMLVPSAKPMPDQARRQIRCMISCLVIIREDHISNEGHTLQPQSPNV